MFYAIVRKRGIDKKFYKVVPVEIKVKGKQWQQQNVRQHIAQMRGMDMDVK